MPLYFAYGANLDRAGMAERCPASTVVGVASLPDHRFIVTRDGYATVLPYPGAVVYGLLWTLAPSDIAALDDYEEVDGGLYRQAIRPVSRDGGRMEAMVYLAAQTMAGRPKPGYIEAVLHAAETCGLPAGYCDDLRRWLPAG